MPLELVKQGTKNNIVKETMFVSHYSDEILSQMPKCLRVMPHHQNTSGFFITIIEKIAEFDVEKEAKQDPSPCTDNLPILIQKKGKNKGFDFVRADLSDPDIQYIKSYFGITDEFDWAQVIAPDQ